MNKIMDIRYPAPETGFVFNHPHVHPAFVKVPVGKKNVMIGCSKGAKHFLCVSPAEKIEDEIQI